MIESLHLRIGWESVDSYRHLPMCIRLQIGYGKGMDDINYLRRAMSLRAESVCPSGINDINDINDINGRCRLIGTHKYERIKRAKRANRRMNFVSIGGIEEISTCARIIELHIILLRTDLCWPWLK